MFLLHYFFTFILSYCVWYFGSVSLSNGYCIYINFAITSYFILDPRCKLSLLSVVRNVRMATLERCFVLQSADILCVLYVWKREKELGGRGTCVSCGQQRTTDGMISHEYCMNVSYNQHINGNWLRLECNEWRTKGVATLKNGASWFLFLVYVCVCFFFRFSFSLIMLTK